MASGDFITDVLGDGPDLRDYVIKNGCVEPLLQLVKPDTPVSSPGNWRLMG